jgi:hypothetical protein
MPSIGASGPEHRRCKRSKTLRSGRIVYNNKQCVVGCTIRDMSENGARLEVPSVFDVPREFDLIVTGGPTRGCTVVWGAKTQIGVHFAEINADQASSAGDAAADSHDLRARLLQRVDHLQHQLDDIRTQLAGNGKSAAGTDNR